MSFFDKIEKKITIEVKRQIGELQALIEARANNSTNTKVVKVVEVNSSGDQNNSPNITVELPNGKQVTGLKPGTRPIGPGSTCLLTASDKVLLT